MRATVFIGLLSACQTTTVDPALYTTTPTYTEDIQPILETWCVDCHSHDGVMYAGVELDTYASARSTRARSTCTAITPELIDRFGAYLLPLAGSDGQSPCAPWEPHSMPPGAMARLSVDEQILLARWVETGALEGP